MASGKQTRLFPTPWIASEKTASGETFPTRDQLNVGKAYTDSLPPTFVSTSEDPFPTCFWLPPTFFNVEKIPISCSATCVSHMWYFTTCIISLFHNLYYFIISKPVFLIFHIFHICLVIIIIRGLLKKYKETTKYLHNSKNGKSPQVHHEKYQKCPVNNARNIFGTRLFRFGYCLVHDCLDLTIIWYTII